MPGSSSPASDAKKQLGAEVPRSIPGVKTPGFGPKTRGKAAGTSAERGGEGSELKIRAAAAGGRSLPSKGPKFLEMAEFAITTSYLMVKFRCHSASNRFCLPLHQS